MPLQGAIDVDRGVTIRQIVKFKDQHRFDPDPKYGGLTVVMYKDEPGVYYNVHGQKMPEEFASAAGFDTAKFAKSRRKMEAMKDFERKLSQELAMEADEEVILAENSEYKVIGLPMDRARIVDRETGMAVTQVPMVKADAIELFNSLSKRSLEDAQAAEIVMEPAKGKANSR